jgi:hypothetical protein
VFSVLANALIPGSAVPNLASEGVVGVIGFNISF